MSAVSLKRKFNDYDNCDFFQLPNAIQIYSLCFLDGKALIEVARTSKLFYSCVVGTGKCKATKKGMKFLGEVNWLRVLRICDHTIGVDFCAKYLGKVVGDIPLIPSAIVNKCRKGFELIFHPGSFIRKDEGLVLDLSTASGDKKARVKKANHPSNAERDMEISNTPRNLVFLTEYLKPTQFAAAPDRWPFPTESFEDAGTQSHWSYQKIEPLLTGTEDTRGLNPVPLEDRLYYHCASVLQSGEPRAHPLMEGSSLMRDWPLPLLLLVDTPRIFIDSGPIGQIGWKTAYGLPIEK